MGIRGGSGPWRFGCGSFQIGAFAAGNGNAVDAFDLVQGQPDLPVGYGNLDALVIAPQNRHVIIYPAVPQFHFRRKQRTDGQNSRQKDELERLQNRVPLLFDAHCVRLPLMSQ